MDFKQSKKLIRRTALFYWILAIVVYLVSYHQFRYSDAETDMPSPNGNVGEIIDGQRIEQTVVFDGDTITSIDVMAATYQRQNTGSLIIRLIDSEGNELTSETADVNVFADNGNTVIKFDRLVRVEKGEKITVLFETEGSESGKAITLLSGNSADAGRTSIPLSISDKNSAKVDGNAIGSLLCFELIGYSEINFYLSYWYIVVIAFAVVSIAVYIWWKQAKKGKNNPLVAICTMLTKYRFLISQLVSRDFKTKYKRSVLGVAWSFLNPLLTMLVQYIVFSTLFNSDIPNYPVYLLTGIVFMNFFNEAVSMSMTSITGNAPLIKKVYMPKYIYPISRVLSSLVNFSFALIPLFLFIAITGAGFHASLLLLVFDLLCLLGFITGMALLLTTAMTFFQDTQFLLSVVSMMWMYLTPVFYPETIIPSQFETLYHMNPMYQYITFARICIIDGHSPAPAAYLWCIISSAVILLLGILAFRKHQDEFILYL